MFESTMEKAMQVMKCIPVHVLTFAAGSAFAAANCPSYPKSEWMPEADAKAKIEAQGYVIGKFKVDGNCYEIYGTNKEGKRAEVYFDAKTLDIVKAEIRK
jgi:hypothetical protein